MRSTTILQATPHQAVLGSVVASLLLLAGCGGDSAPETKPPTQPAAVSSPKTVDEDQPLTASRLREKLGVDSNARFEKVGSRFVGADLMETGARDLSALRGLPLQQLNLLGNPVSDIAPLEGMPLKTLQLRQTRVADLSSLKGAPLEELDLTRTLVTDLSPLTGAPLKLLDMSETKITSLAPLTGMPLEYLFLEKTGVENLGPLTGMPLKKLYCRESRIANLSPLSGMPLDELNVCQTQVTDISPLRGLALKSLWLRDNRIQDLSALQESELESLDIQGTDVPNLDVVASIGTLKRLNIAQTPITDLRPLAGLALERLIFTPQNIQHGIEIVRSMPTLREIDIEFENSAARTPEAFWAAFDAGEFQKK